MGTWIETNIRLSLIEVECVVPLVGTWIETSKNPDTVRAFAVVPLVGTWIETEDDRPGEIRGSSFPSWERGLKPTFDALLTISSLVVPLVGTWIETFKNPLIG